jgi:transcriptional regulator with XRE-family HTH domain
MRRKETEDLGQIGATLKRLREQRGLTQLEVETMVGIDSGNLSRVERGVQRINQERLEALLSAYGVNLTDLLLDARDQNAPATTLGKRLKQARLRARLTQGELASRAEVEQALVSQIETGKINRSSHLTKMAVVCGVSPAWLSEGVGSMTDNAGQPDAGVDRLAVFTPQAMDLTITSPEANGRWQVVNSVLLKCRFAGADMLLMQTSFERPEFELHYMSYRQGGFTSQQEAKDCATGYARYVLKILSDSIATLDRRPHPETDLVAGN